MEARTIGRAIGAASLAFGVTDIVMGKTFGRGIGAEHNGALLFRSVGAREVATGVAGLIWPHSSAPVWTRFAADLVDLATLGTIIAKPNPRRGMAITAFAIVAGVALLDFLGAIRQDKLTEARS
jgi:hypothetical protein